MQKITFTPIPKREKLVITSVRIPTSLHASVEEIAESLGVSQRQVIETSIQDYVLNFQAAVKGEANA